VPSAQSAFVQRTLRRAILLPAVAAVVVSAVFLGIIQRLLWETERLNHGEEVISTAEQIRQLVVDMETGVRGYLLANDRRFLEPYDGASKAFPELQHHLESLVSDNPEQRRRLAVINSDVAEWQRHAEQIMRSHPAERELVVAKVMMDRVRTDVQVFLQAERALSIERARRLRQTTTAAIAITIALAAIAGAVLTVFIRGDLRQISARYESALQTAEHAAVVKDRLLATVSHELRTPLTSILGWSTLLRAQRADEETTKLALTSIEQSARLQSRLIEDLIDVSRAATGRLRMDITPIDLRQVLQNALETMKPAAEAKGLTISTSIAVADFKMMGDAARLQQVFWNLLSNAVRFTPSGGKIELQAVTDEASAVVRVTDNGVGIERQFLPHVFETFSQEKEPMQRSMGLGLGLAIARRLVELHGGTIEAKSDGPGHGAEFTVRLPLSRESLSRPDVADPVAAIPLV